MFDEKASLLAPHFKPAVLQREKTIFQFRFEDGAPFYLEVSLQEFSFVEGEHTTPTLTIFVRDHDTCWGLLEGRLDGMQAFSEGLYRADGNIVLSQLLLYLFHNDNPAIAYQVKD